MQTKTVLIAEDEPLARESLRDSILERPELHLIGEAADGAQALALINQLKPDVVFMDIQMPEMTGLEVLKRLTHLPEVVFTTAFDQHAVMAFELNAVDYLLKPFSRDRFNAAVERLQGTPPASGEALQLALSQAAARDAAMFERILVRDRGRIFPLSVNAIEYLKADAKYTAIVSEKRTFLVRVGIAELGARLDPAKFIRIHRSVMVNLDFVESMVTDEQSQLQLQMRDGSCLTASREASKMLRDMSI
jgi:two-component system LytT family response regulator